VKVPFFGGLPIYKLGKFFFNGLLEGFLTSRAAAIAFNFFLAIFPSIIFLFSLIPYIPIEGFQEELIHELMFAAPNIMDTFIEETLIDIIENKQSSLVSLGFFLALYFATNGINSMLTAFSMSTNVHKDDQHSFISLQIKSITVMVVLTVFLILATVLTIFGEQIVDLIFRDFLHFDKAAIVGFQFARWLIIIGFVYFSVAYVYYHGPKQKRKFFSPGASLATFFLILFTMGFGFYVENFATYNKLYGSIGTVMGIMLMIYLNSLALLIGYELNAAIDHASTHLKLDEYK
jgi:membrane protein